MELHNLYEPVPVSFRFETPGWFILAGILLFVVILVIIRLVMHYRKNRYRREALQKLEHLDKQAELFPQLFVVLKQTATHAFGRERVGQLYGLEWLSFLEKTGKEVRMTDYQDQILGALYAGKTMEPDTRKTVLSNAKIWVRTHAG